MPLLSRGLWWRFYPAPLPTTLPLLLEIDRDQLPLMPDLEGHPRPILRPGWIGRIPTAHDLQTCEPKDRRLPDSSRTSGVDALRRIATQILQIDQSTQHKLLVGGIGQPQL